MTLTQTEKGDRFYALHQDKQTFVMPNPWDIGSARILNGLGFRALATSSFASAVALGRQDGGIGREEALNHARLIVSATDLPVSGDLENGFGNSPEAVAETIRCAADAGLVGGSIEDYSGDSAHPLYDPSFAAERVTAAVETAKKLPFRFTLTARAENFFRGNPNLDDTIARLQAYERAGADVLFAPNLPTLDAVRAVCSSVSKPVNFMAGMPGRSFSVAELSAAGVRRISLGASLHRAALHGMIDAAKEVSQDGKFNYTNGLPSGADVYKLLGG